MAGSQRGGPGSKAERVGEKLVPKLRGIGFELAAQLATKDTYHVLLGSRSSGKGESAVQELLSRKLPGSMELVQIDATDDESIERAAVAVQRKHGKLDILVNNAEIENPSSPQRYQVREAFNTNATGPAVVTEAFAPLLKKSAAWPRIVNISHGAGSINRISDTSSPVPEIRQAQYQASKAALNMATACQWVEYRPFGIQVFAYDLGVTQPSIGPQNGALNGAKSAVDAVMPLIDILEGRRDAEAGKLLHSMGSFHWWQVSCINTRLED
ncbi:MAG: hypothetical protein M1820_002014 [Bogoriella megaspora]|nr:MAG: hypothetical protein M1820_002014 [Bogoriella megaspora]